MSSVTLCPTIISVRACGDVSAVVTLDQEELYTYNNTDTFHISEAAEPSRATEVISVSVEDSRIRVQAYCVEDVTANAWCAFYDENGQFLDVEVKPLTAGEANDLTFALSAHAATEAKLFILDENFVPQCASRGVTLG